MAQSKKSTQGKTQVKKITKSQQIVWEIKKTKTIVDVPTNVSRTLLEIRKAFRVTKKEIHHKYLFTDRPNRLLLQIGHKTLKVIKITLNEWNAMEFRKITKLFVSIENIRTNKHFKTFERVSSHLLLFGDDLVGNFRKLTTL